MDMGPKTRRLRRAKAHPDVRRYRGPGIVQEAWRDQGPGTVQEAWGVPELGDTAESGKVPGFGSIKESGEDSDSGQVASGHADSAPEEILKAVLLGECRFDTKLFLALQEFTDRFPDSKETVPDSLETVLDSLETVPDSLETVPGYLETVPGYLESAPEEESLPSKIHAGKVLFAIADLYGLGSFQRYEGMFGETAACVGFPTVDGSGGTLLFPGNAFGITAMSQHREGAWKFIESILNLEEEAQMEPEELVNSIRWQLNGPPSLKKILDIMIEYRLEDDRKWAEEGRRFGAQIYDDGWIIEFHALTQEEIDTVLGQVKDARPYFSAEEDQVIRIISEEAAAYYSGQKSPEEVTRVIQNRVQLYVNENM